MSWLGLGALRTSVSVGLARSIEAQSRTAHQCCSDQPHVSTHLLRTTARRFEPLRAEPNGFRVYLLNHSDKVSCLQKSALLLSWW